jgi:hypothetical protein
VAVAVGNRLPGTLIASAAEDPVTSSSSACCKISRAPRRPTVSIGSSLPATPASTSSSIFDFFRVKAEATPV